MIIDSALSTAAVAISISAAQSFGWVLTLEQAPQALVALFQTVSLSQWQLYLVLNILFLIVGCFMEGIAVLVMTIPVVMPIIQQAGIDPVHFGVVFTVNSMIGTITPPVGMIMYEVGELAHRSGGRRQPVHGCGLALLSDRKAADHGVILWDLEHHGVQAVRRRRTWGAGDKGRGKRESPVLSPIEIHLRRV